MTTEVGVWIDHRKAVIATLTEHREDLREVTSHMEQHVRDSGAAEEDSAEDQPDRRYTERLNRYYDEVVGSIRDADSILIFGPGEAKAELQRRMLREGVEGSIIGIETVDKMTDGQIGARVQDYFRGSTRSLEEKDADQAQDDL